MYFFNCCFVLITSLSVIHYTVDSFRHVDIRGLNRRAGSASILSFANYEVYRYPDAFLSFSFSVIEQPLLKDTFTLISNKTSSPHRPEASTLQSYLLTIKVDISDCSISSTLLRYSRPSTRQMTKARKVNCINVGY